MTYLIMLSAEIEVPAALSKAEKIAIWRDRANEARGRVFPQVEALKSLDPELKVFKNSSMTPFLVLETTSQEVLSKVKGLEGVESVDENTEGELHLN